MIKRNRYVSKLVKKQWNGRIKIITGIRRCGKSTLLFELFKEYLVNSGVPEENIISFKLDDDEYEDFRDPKKISEYVRKIAADRSKKYYVFIDEVQYAISTEELRQKDKPVRLYSVLNGFVNLKNIDCYVTGSNSKMLSKDVSTEFRGRGDVVQVYPLSFSEFYSGVSMEKMDAYNEFMMFGGMPYLLQLDSNDDKFKYLYDLFEEIYFKDIEERYPIELPSVLRELTSALCSSVGSLTNASKLSRSIQSLKNIKVDSETISLYFSYLKDCFLFTEAERFDVKGKKYFAYPSKFYCADIGLRNVRLGLRQQEESHILENCVYNELLARDFSVDVGVVPIVQKNEEGKRIQSNCEIDFIATKGSKKYYILSALSMDDAEKERAELRPLLSLNDSFKKIVVSKSYGKNWTDENGILRINPIDFLLDEESLDL